MESYNSKLLDYSNTYKVYILALEQNKFYIGISKDVRKRFAEHCYGISEYGAGYTRKYKPLKIVDIIPTEHIDKLHAQEIENKITINMMKKYGIDNVRGGVFVQCDTDRLLRTMPKDILKMIIEG